MNNEITIDGVAYVRKEEVEAVEEPKPWPQVGDEYWTLASDKVDVPQVWYHDPVDRDRLERGNAFRNYKEAELADQERIAIATIKNYAREKWGEFEPDWESSSRHKWYIYKVVDDGYGTSFNGTLSYCPKLGHFAKKEHTEEIIEKFTKELDIIFS